MRNKVRVSFFITARLRRLMLLAALAALLGIGLCACAAEPPPATEEPVRLEPIVVPTMPAEIPEYLEEDPDTGLHMTGTPIVVDLYSYRLKVSGKVDKELSLTYDELRLLPKVTAAPELVCGDFFVDTVNWSGVPLTTIFDMAGIQPDAAKIVMVSADGYKTTLKLENAKAPENFLAYELEGKPLPVLHGFPLRAVFPGRNGLVWVKWLTEIVVE